MAPSRREKARRERGRVAFEMSLDLRKRLEAAAREAETDLSSYVRGCILERLERQRGAARLQPSQN